MQVGLAPRGELKIGKARDPGKPWLPRTVVTYQKLMGALDLP